MNAQILTGMDFRPQAKETSASHESAYALLQQYWLLLLIYMAALLFDTISTINFMMKEGIHMELHPLVRYSSYLYGPIVGPLLSAFLFKALAGMILLFYFKHYAHLILKAAIITAMLAGVYNFFQYAPPM